MQQLAYAPVRQMSRTPAAAKNSASSGISKLESAPISASSRKSTEQRSVINITVKQATRVIRIIFALHFMEHMLYGMAWKMPLHTTARKVDDSSDLQVEWVLERLYFKYHPRSLRPAM